MLNDTIVAVATPLGEGGLAVVRLSGPDAVTIASRVFSGPGFPANVESHRAVYGILKHPGGDLKSIKKETYTIDQVLALPLLAPHSYTGEDTVEFFCHGGLIVPRSVVAACRAAGATPAAAGEFTRRAFLNGKISLDQAEAVADLIHAQGEVSARAAVRQLRGGLDGQLLDIEGPLLELLAEIEGSLEFAEDEEVAVPLERVLDVLKRSSEGISTLLSMAPAGRLLRDGIHVVLAGPANAGKSSLFNALLQADRAIVDEEAGTTRDVVSERLVREGNVFVLHDTAGLRSVAGRVEHKGIERTWKKVEEADIVLLLQEADPAGANVFQKLPTTAPVIRVLTKGDLADPESGLRSGHAGYLVTSSVRGTGIKEVWRAIDETVAGFRLQEAVALGVVLNERHQQKLQRCLTDLRMLVRELERRDPGDEVTGTLLSSLLSGLGEVSGRVFSEQLLESVFQRFCIGK